MSNIKVGYLISYDYEYLRLSLPRVYKHVTEIVLAIDSERKTWSGNDLIIPDDFFDWIALYDEEKKIRIYEDQFYLPELSSMECDTRERNMLGKQMGKCDWYVQIDSDEYFLDFEAFVNKLNSFAPKAPTTILLNVATLFKQVRDGYLLIGDSFETLSFATNNPVYDLARNNNSGNKKIYWDDLVLHQSWARTDAEISQKLNNWSHKDDFNTESLYKLWWATDEFNFHCLSNFHPLVPETWPRLVFIKGNIPGILDMLKKQAKGGITALLRRKKKSVFSRVWREIRS